MHIRCPHCQNPIELLPDQPDDSRLSCPSCGSALDFLRETIPATAARRAKIGRFELVQHVGRGQFGDVWKARDTQLDRTVAVKIPRTLSLDDAEQQLFVREARAVAQLRHPHIVPVHEVGHEDTTTFIVSDFVEGVTLKDVIRHRRPSAREAAALCVTIADALQHAHDAGVVHRDLKPGNIMIDGAGRPFLMDFGLAKRDAGEITVTLDGQVLGTPAYMSPEQARGDAHTADRRSDIYSLGVILYELLTGELPFRGGSTMLIHQILSHDPRPPRKLDAGLPKDLETICLKAMEKDPARRYATAREMALDLERFLEGKPILARPIGRLERAWRWTRRNRAASVAIGTSLLSLALLLVLLVFWGVAESPGAAVEMVPVLLETEPPGARAVFVPVNKADWQPEPERAVRPEGTTPLEVDLPPGTYLVVVERRGHGFHEVYRTVPSAELPPSPGAGLAFEWSHQPDGRVRLPAIRILRTAAAVAGKAYFAGGEFTMGDARWPVVTHVHSRRVEPFYLDRDEVSVADYRRVMGGLPTSLEKQDPEPPGESAVRYVRFQRALEYAERVGMRLPLEEEFEFAATNAGTTDFPWGDDAGRITSWELGAVGHAEYDRTQTEPPVRGLYSNVGEWTLSRHTPYPGGLELGMSGSDINLVSRVVRGGPWSVATGEPDPAEWGYGPRWRHAVLEQSQLPGLGFRCAQSERPRFLDAEAGP